MKKFLMLAVILGLSLSAYCQPSVFDVYHVVIIDKKTEKIVSSTEVDYKMNINKATITFENKASTTYIADKYTQQEFKDKDRNYSQWKAVDEENISCVVTMSYYFKGIKSISVSYSDLFIVYYFR